MIMQLTKLSNLFEAKYGVNLELFSLEENSKRNGEFIPFVSRTENNNGVSAFVRIDPSLNAIQKNTLTVAVSGSVLSAFLQPYDYYSGRDLYYLIPKRKMTERELIYYAICIKKNKYKYSYGRQANKTLRDLLIPTEIPEKFLNLEIEKLNENSFSDKKISLNTKNWKWFGYPEVFDLVKGYYNNRPELDPVGIPFISATENNNGITDFVIKEGTKIFSGRSITVSNDGSIGNAFYQEKDFTCSHSVNVIKINKKYKKELNQYIALFLAPLIQKEKFRFNYGFKWRIERMKESKIKLPVNKDGNPDWEFMEDYIKSLPYSASI